MSIRFAILTVSDRSAAGQREDVSGPLLEKLIQQQGWTVSQMGIVPDEKDEIEKILVEWVGSDVLDVILTTGGTGFAARDVTPEATLSIVERRTPGIVEAIRAKSLAITPHAMLSRAEAGIRAKVLIINFPGSPKAVRENFEVIQPVLAHAVDLLREAPDSEEGHRK